MSVFAHDGVNSIEPNKYKTNLRVIFKPDLIILLMFLGALVDVQGQGSAFTYRGRLTAAGAPANGAHDMEFKLFSDTPDLSILARLG